MTRIISLTAICLLLLAALTPSALAAEGITLTITPSAETAAPGEELTFTVTASSTAKCRTFGLMLTVDPASFEIAEGECTAKGAMLPIFDAQRGIAVLYGTATAPEGEVGNFTVRLTDTAPEGELTITGTPSAKDGEAKIPCTVIPAVVQVAAAKAQPTSAAPVQPQTVQTTLPDTVQVTQNQTDSAISGQLIPAQTEEVPVQMEETTQETTAVEPDTEKKSGAAAWLPLGAALLPVLLLLKKRNKT